MTTVEEDREASAAIDAWRHAPADERPLAARVDRGRRRFRGALATITVTLGVASGLVGVALARHHGPVRHRRPVGVPTWAQVTGVAVFTVSVLVVVGSLVWAWRHGRLRDSRRSPLWALTWRERSRALKQMRGRLPYTPEQVPLLRVLATGSRRNGWYAWLLSGVLGNQVAQAFLHDNAFFAVLGLLAVAALGTAVASLSRQAASARRFLEREGLP